VEEAGVAGEAEVAEHAPTTGRTPGEWLDLVARAGSYWNRWWSLLGMFVLIGLVGRWHGTWMAFVYALGTLTAVTVQEVGTYRTIGPRLRADFPGRWHATGVRVEVLDHSWFGRRRRKLTRTGVVAHSSGIGLFVRQKGWDAVAEGWIPLNRIEWFATAEARPGQAAVVIAVDPKGARGAGIPGQGALLLRLHAEPDAIRSAFGELGLTELPL
jgi:hypothetical protein